MTKTSTSKFKSFFKWLGKQFAENTFTRIFTLVIGLSATSNFLFRESIWNPTISFISEYAYYPLLMTPLDIVIFLLCLVPPFYIRKKLKERINIKKPSFEFIKRGNLKWKWDYIAGVQIDPYCVIHEVQYITEISFANNQYGTEYFMYCAECGRKTGITFRWEERNDIYKEVKKIASAKRDGHYKGK